MSLYDDASLIYYPSGYKASKAYSLKPTDGSGDLTFTRASSATRVNSAGLIEKVRTNLLLQSNSFDTTWGNVNTTETSGQSDPNGGTTAWLLTKSASTGQININVSNTGETTFSLYMKAGNSQYGVLTIAAPRVYAFFDLSAGTTGFVTSGATSSITSIGGGWYRCSVTVGYCSYVEIYQSDTNTTITGTTGTLNIWSGQVESGVMTDFIGNTTTTAVSVGMLADVPRIDYTGGGCGKLLLEPQRTNLVTYSEDFTNAAWTKSNATITANAATSPDGYVNADKLIATAVSGFHSMSQTIGSKIALTPYTFSFFAKADEISFCLPNISTAFSGTQLAALINLSDGTASGVSAGLSVSTEDYGNGWYRIKLTATSQNNTSAFLVTINATNASGASNFTGDGTSGILLYGAQVEAGSYVSSYVPTLATAVTRTQDTSVTTGLSSVIGQTEGVFYVEIAALVNDNSGRYISISNSTNNNRIIIGFDTASNRIYVYVTSSGSSQVSMFYEVSDILNFNKVAFKYKVNDFSLWVNGVERATDIIGILPTSLTSITFNSGGGGNIFYGKMQNLMVFPTVLSDDDLTLLTGTLGETYFKSYALMANYLNYTIQ